MFRKGILTPDDMRVIDTMLRAKYRPLFGGIYPQKPLINQGFRGNMTAAEGEVL
jgi:hypothetical protein